MRIFKLKLAINADNTTFESIPDCVRITVNRAGFVGGVFLKWEGLVNPVILISVMGNKFAVFSEQKPDSMTINTKWVGGGNATSEIHLVIADDEAIK